MRDPYLTLPSTHRVRPHIVDSSRGSAWTARFLQDLVRLKPYEDTTTGKHRHLFLIDTFNVPEFDILDNFIESFEFSAQRKIFWNLEKEDLELRMSESSAVTGTEKRIFGRFRFSETLSDIYGGDGMKCDNLMLGGSDYLIDDSLETVYTSCIINHTQPGILYATILTSPERKAGRRDRPELANRIISCVWLCNSGYFHREYEWFCGRYRSKCNRERCRVNPEPDESTPWSTRHPLEGDVRWKELAVKDVCQLFHSQNRPGA
jgi:hypothetical protein